MDEFFIRLGRQRDRNFSKITPVTARRVGIFRSVSVISLHQAGLRLTLSAEIRYKKKAAPLRPFSGMERYDVPRSVIAAFMPTAAGCAPLTEDSRTTAAGLPAEEITYSGYAE